MTKVDTLLKKGKGKLTGDEVGRLMIADLIECYKQAFHGGDANSGLFTDKEKTELVNAVEGREEIARYNKFRYLNDFLTRFPALSLANEQMFENYYFRLYSLLRQVHAAENEYFFDKFRPLIVTEERYKELVEQELEQKKSWSYTPESLFFDRLKAIIEDYKAGKRTGINAELDKLKTQPIKRERIRKFYWESGANGHYETQDGKTEGQVNPAIWQDLLAADELVFVDEREAPEDATAFDVLEYADCFYYSEETDSTETLAELKEDFPTIWAFVWKKLTSCKALAPLKDMSYEDYFTDFITLEELAKADAFDYRKELTTFSGLDISGYSGVAVMKAGKLNEETETLDRMPLYHLLAEHLLEGETEEIIADNIETQKNALIALYAYNAALDIISEKLGIEGLAIFKSDTSRYANMVAVLNDLFSQFYDLTRCGKVPDERPAEELNAIFKKLLKPIKIMELQPSEELIARMKAEFSLDALEGKGMAFTDEIAQSVKDAIKGE